MKYTYLVAFSLHHGIGNITVDTDLDLTEALVAVVRKSIARDFGAEEIDVMIVNIIPLKAKDA